MNELIFNDAIFSEIEKKPITNDSTAKVVTKKYDDRPSDEEIADDVIHMGKEGYGYGEDREKGGDYEVDWVKRDEKVNNSRRTIKSSISLPSKPYGKYGLKLGKQTGNGYHFNTYSVKTSDGDVVGAIEFHYTDAKEEYCVAWNYNGYSGVGGMGVGSMYKGKTKSCDTVEECFEFIEREIDDGNNIVMNEKLNNSHRVPHRNKVIKNNYYDGNPQTVGWLIEKLKNSGCEKVTSCWHTEFSNISVREEGDSVVLVCTRSANQKSTHKTNNLISMLEQFDPYEFVTMRLDTSDRHVTANEIKVEINGNSCWLIAK